LLCFLAQQRCLPDNGDLRRAKPYIRERYPYCNSPARVKAWLNPQNANVCTVDIITSKKRNGAAAFMRMIEMGYPAMGRPNWPPLEAVEAFLAEEDVSVYAQRNEARKAADRRGIATEHKSAPSSSPRSEEVARAEVPDAAEDVDPGQREDDAMHLERTKDHVAYQKNIKKARVVNMTLAEFYDQLHHPPSSSSQAPHVPPRAYDLIQLDPFYGASHHPSTKLLKKYRKLFDACSKVVRMCDRLIPF
jgi:hypothetical protein